MLEKKLNPLQKLLEKVKGPDIAEAIMAVKKYIEDLQSKNKSLAEENQKLEKEAAEAHGMNELLLETDNLIENCYQQFLKFNTPNHDIGQAANTLFELIPTVNKIKATVNDQQKLNRKILITFIDTMKTKLNSIQAFRSYFLEIRDLEPKNENFSAQKEALENDVKNLLESDNITLEQFDQLNKLIDYQVIISKSSN